MGRWTKRCFSYGSGVVRASGTRLPAPSTRDPARPQDRAGSVCFRTSLEPSELLMDSRRRMQQPAGSEIHNLSGRNDLGGQEFSRRCILMHFAALTRRRSASVVKEQRPDPQKTHPVRYQTNPVRCKCKILALFSCNALRSAARDFRPSPAASFAQPALARASLNPSGAFANREFGGFSAKPPRPLPGRANPRPAWTYVRPDRPKRVVSKLRAKRAGAATCCRSDGSRPLQAT